MLYSTASIIIMYKDLIVVLVIALELFMSTPIDCGV